MKNPGILNKHPFPFVPSSPYGRIAGHKEQIDYQVQKSALSKPKMTHCIVCSTIRPIISPVRPECSESECNELKNVRRISTICYQRFV